MTVSIELTNLSPVLTIKHVRPVNRHTNPPSDEFLKSVGMKKTSDSANSYYWKLAGCSVLYSILGISGLVAAFLIAGPVGAIFYAFAIAALPCGLISDKYFGRNQSEQSERNSDPDRMRGNSRRLDTKDRRLIDSTTVRFKSRSDSMHRQHQKNSIDALGRRLK